MQPSSSTAARPRWRVLHALFSPRMAGSERYCVDLANAQAAQGHLVHVVGQPDSPMLAALSSAVSYHAMRTPLFLGMRVRSLIERISPDICHAHLSPACKILGSASRDVPTVATLHVGYKPHQHKRLGGLVCVNSAQLGRLGDYPGHKRVIPNWLPSSDPRTGASRQQRRAALGFDDSHLLLGVVGRLHPSKGVDVLIQAFRSFAPAHAGLLIIGEGPQRKALEALIAGDPRIRLLGYRDDVRGLLGALDLFVSPSREESFGLAILEAMAAGLPMVATAAEGPSEILRGSTVDLVAPGSAHDLGIALTRLFARLDAGGPRRISYDLRPYEQAAGVAAIGDFYSQVMQRHRRSTPTLGPLQGVHAGHV
jgi:glycosyltransferase involved in cell wall biosynthesis